MSDGLGRLATAAAVASVRELAAAAAAVSEHVWLGEGDGWLPIGHDGGSAPPKDATYVTTGGYRVALTGDVQLAALLVGAGLERLAAQDARNAAESRLELNERIAGMGSYDWNILTDENQWSDELYRIYGHEPGAFNASYDRFIELVHPDDRDRIREVHAEAYGSGEPYEMEEHIVLPDGSVRTLWSNGAVLHDEDGTPVRMVGVCRDITEQREAEHAAALQRDQIRDADLLRAQALELNDNVVQGLTAAGWAIDSGTPLSARAIVTETLAHAREMMHELLEAAQGPTTAGSLVRAVPARTTKTASAAGSSPASDTPRCRVVLADDTEDLRMMLRVSLELGGQVEVVGEAADGQGAIDVVARTRPDAVLLDLSMPRMDGLQACSQIRANDPQVRIVILSGWGDATMGQRASEAGADAYVQKGGSIDSIVTALLAGATVGG